MAEASISISQDYFGCSICLQLLKEPVTTPCGHSFCKVCINGFWDSEVPKKIYSCPHCRETFTPRPDLRKSNVLTEIIELVEKSEQQTSFAQALDSFDTQDAECDSCIGEKNKAVKSCLTCMASYCHIHVQAHHESPAFKKHTLIKAMSNLSEKTCAQHNKLLDVFCRKDQRVICHQCSTDKHSDHETVPVEKEWIEKKKYFEELQQKYHNRLENKEKTLLELKDVIAAYKISTQELVKESDGIFSELIASIEKRRFEVTKIIRAQEKAELDQTAEVLQQLEAEIADIKKRQADLEKLSQTTGYVHFLQRFQFLSPKLETTADTFSVTFNSQWSFESLKKTLIQLKEEMDDFCKEKMEKLSEIAVTFDPILIMPEPQTREEFLKYSCQLSFDPNTANCYLGLSSESTDVTCANKQHVYPDHPERFSNWTQVLCKQTLPLRSYWEVEVDGANGVSIAVSYKSISRKGSEFGSRFGHNAQSWRLVRYPSKYSFWQNNTRSDVSRPGSRRIGVYLDQKAGTLSFYSVSNQMSLIYKLTTVFTQPLYAGFGLGTGSSAKICLQVSAAMTAVDGAESLKKK